MDQFKFDEKHLKIITYIISNYPKYLREDLKQELLMKLHKILTTKINIQKIDDYIFIALKNHAISYYKKETKNCHVSLNKIINDEYELLDLIADNDTIQNVIIPIDKLYNIFDMILSNKEKSILIKYFVNNLTQNDIAIFYQTSQQNISKIIKKALNKISAYIKNHNIIL